jgi:hypothetical protein
MVKIRFRGEKIRDFILKHVEQHPRDIAGVAARRFDISRQAVNKHVKKLVEEKALMQHGKTRNLSYKLHPLTKWQRTYSITGALAEDVVWRNDIAPLLGQMPENVTHIWHYGFTEIFNNAIDHSEGKAIHLHLEKTATTTQMVVHDDGIGIFRKIQSALGLLDERQAVLELAKGKLTTDPANHTGEGIFFTSRVFDDFNILSSGVYFPHVFGKDEDWILEAEKLSSGTSVWMKLNNHTARTVKKIFDEYTSGDDYGFTKTVVPVRLAQYGDDKLVSRSQAKRLLARIDRFKIVIFDFEGVESIGPAFADEVFRVFASRHSSIEFHEVNANAEVKRMIKRTRG